MYKQNSLIQHGGFTPIQTGGKINHHAVDKRNIHAGAGHSCNVNMRDF